MLDAAGISYEAVGPDVDEAAVKDRFDDPSSIASELAAAKALSVSRDCPGDWVIGSDSVVSSGGRIFDKPKDREHDALFDVRNSTRPMHLTSAVALARDGAIDWQHVETSELLVRPLSESFIADYLDAEWPEVGYTVGVFRLEGRGVQLFDRIEGDHFAILGMPLIPLLGALRERGVIQS